MRKITGAYRSMLGETEFHERELPLKNPGAFLPAVMVVGDTNDEVPRLFTESEVRAMLEEMIKAKVFRATPQRSDYAVMLSDMRWIAKLHGIVLDPA